MKKYIGFAMMCAVNNQAATLLDMLSLSEI